MDAIVADTLSSGVIDGVVSVALAAETAVGRKLTGYDRLALVHARFDVGLERQR